MEHIITSDIPPPVSGSTGKPATYPFATMKVGDSFFTRAPVNRVGPAARQFGKRHGWKFQCRTEGRGARVWRIA